MTDAEWNEYLRQCGEDDAALAEWAAMKPYDGNYDEDN